MHSVGSFDTSDDFLCTKEDYFICDICIQKCCTQCTPQFDDEEVCMRNNCFYCKNDLRCDNNYISHTYCNDCVPNDIRLKILEREHIKDTIPIRHMELRRALVKAGLELRADSKYCKRYIRQNKGNIKEIVHRMCEMKFLFDYCNMKSILYNTCTKQMQLSALGLPPKYALFEEAEKIVLASTPYPKVWPWQAEKSALVIQRACHNWLWKPYTADGKIGINVRIGMREFGLGDIMFKTQV